MHFTSMQSKLLYGAIRTIDSHFFVTSTTTGCAAGYSYLPTGTHSHTLPVGEASTTNGPSSKLKQAHHPSDDSTAGRIQWSERYDDGQQGDDWSYHSIKGDYNPHKGIHCKLCLSGFFSPGGKSLCQACGGEDGHGFFTAKGASSEEQCICEAGFGGPSCAICPPGTYRCEANSEEEGFRLLARAKQI